MSLPTFSVANCGDGQSLRVRIEGMDAAQHVVNYRLHPDGAWLTTSPDFVSGSGDITIYGLTDKNLYDVIVVAVLGGEFTTSDSQTVRVFARPSGKGINTYQHWFVDLATYSFWPVVLDYGHEPTVTLTHRSESPAEADVILCGRDGYIRRFMDTSETDDGLPFESYVSFGPIPLAKRGHDGLLSEFVGVPGLDSGPTLVGLVTAKNEQELVDATARVFGVWENDEDGKREYKRRPDLRGQCWLARMENGASERRWIFEGGHWTRQEVGRR